MKAPTYRWVCHKCGVVNEPPTVAWVSCNFPAVASSQQLEESLPGYTPKARNREAAERAGWIWLFFPEGFVAGGIALVTAFWSFQLATSGRFAAAIALVIGVALSTYGFWCFIRQGKKFLAYFSMCGSIAISLIIFSI